jgi:hypothetical protein
MTHLHILYSWSLSCIVIHINWYGIVISPSRNIVYCANETPYRGSRTTVGLDALKPIILSDFGPALFTMRR